MFNLVHVTIGSKTGKMQGIDSINTSSLKNEFCQKMASNEKSICNKCYSNRTSKMYTSLEKRLIQNSELLSGGFLPLEQLPFINSSVMRFDSFGELINHIHFINLLNIAEKNKHCRFVLWTKRKDIVKKVLDNREKPENFHLIFSSPVKNQVAKLPQYFSKVFTVFDKKTAQNDNIAINCGGKKCIDCMLCYTDNDTIFVNELLK